jgi:hypothetical protein
MTGIDREELRHLVRQALKETLGRESAQAPAPDLADEIRAARAQSKPATVAVAVADSGELDAFARALLAAADDPELKAAIVAGDIRFMPAARAESNGAPGSTGAPASFDKGVLGESKIVELSRKGRRIVIGEAVVVTPLAREKARQLKVELVRQKP